MKKACVFLLLLMFSGSSLAQDVDIVTRKNEGIFNITQAGYLPGVGNISYDGDLKASQSQTYRIRTLFGYFVTPRFSLGLGAGMDAYQNPSLRTMPVFVDARAYLHDARNSSYLFIDMGRSFSVSFPPILRLFRSMSGSSLSFGPFMLLLPDWWNRR